LGEQRHCKKAIIDALRLASISRAYQDIANGRAVREMPVVAALRPRREPPTAAVLGVSVSGARFDLPPRVM
jgi:hypothetical protein